MKAVWPRSKSCCPCSVSTTPFLLRRASRTFRVSSSADSRRESVAFGMPVARSAAASPPACTMRINSASPSKSPNVVMFHLWNVMATNIKPAQGFVPSSSSGTSDDAHNQDRRLAMPTTFTAENSALLLIDHQVGTMQLIKNIDVERAKRMSLALAKTASILGIPTVLTSSQEDRLQGPLLPEFKDILPEAFEKRVKREGIVNAWTDANFKAAVEATGRKNLIMDGVTTDVCLVFPAIDAVREGYNVQAVMDASGSPFELSEEMSRRRMQDAGVVLTATNTVIAELAQNWSTPQGQQLVQLLFTEVLPSIQS